MIEAYQLIIEGEECRIRAGQVVHDSLEDHKRSGKKAAKDVLKIWAILKRLGDYGHGRLNNTEQFKREGKFASGGKQGGEVAVYAVKAFQLRVYGGFVKGRSNTPTFVCVECAVKKRDRADQAQLMRVARVLGEINEQL